MFKKMFDSLLGKNNEANEKPDEVQNLHIQNDKSEAIEEEDETATNHELDPETLHGKHYTVEDFDKEVARRAEKWIASEQESGETMSQKDQENIYFNYRREVYREWTGADTDQLLQWEMANSMKHTGIATSGFVHEDANNPLFAPIHGVSLKDYAAMANKISQGVDFQLVCKAMGIEPAVWEEVNTLWPKRMQEDASYSVSTLFGQYFMEGGNHQTLQHLQAEQSELGKANLEKIKTDRYFYEELCGARQAAYAYGLDGAQWIADNFGINLGEFQAVAMEWMTEQNKAFNSNDVMHFSDYQQAKEKEYAEKFAAEQGGNIADDVSF